MVPSYEVQIIWAVALGFMLGLAAAIAYICIFWAAFRRLINEIEKGE